MKTLGFHLNRGAAGTAAGAVLLGVYEGLALLFPGASHAVLILAAAALIGVVSAALRTAGAAMAPRVVRLLMRQLAGAAASKAAAVTPKPGPLPPPIVQDGPPAPEKGAGI